MTAGRSTFQDQIEAEAAGRVWIREVAVKLHREYRIRTTSFVLEDGRLFTLWAPSLRATAMIVRDDFNRSVLVTTLLPPHPAEGEPA